MTIKLMHYIRCINLVAERGYRRPRLLDGRLLVNFGAYGPTVNYVTEILAPCGLVPWDRLVADWADAERLLGMLPPARGIEPRVDSLHPQGF